MQGEERREEGRRKGAQSEMRWEEISFSRTTTTTTMLWSSQYTRKYQHRKKGKSNMLRGNIFLIFSLFFVCHFCVVSRDWVWEKGRFSSTHFHNKSFGDNSQFFINKKRAISRTYFVVMLYKKILFSCMCCFKLSKINQIIFCCNFSSTQIKYFLYKIAWKSKNS